MARKRVAKPDIDSILDGINVTTLPFQSRTMLAQYVLATAEARLKRAALLHECFPCTIRLAMPELGRGNTLVT